MANDKYNVDVTITTPYPKTSPVFWNNIEQMVKDLVGNVDYRSNSIIEVTDFSYVTATNTASFTGWAYVAGDLVTYSAVTVSAETAKYIFATGTVGTPTLTASDNMYDVDGALLGQVTDTDTATAMYNKRFDDGGIYKWQVAERMSFLSNIMYFPNAIQLNATGKLDLTSSTEVELNATLIDINATTIDLTGALTLAGLANLDGGIAVDTNKFTVADTTGNTVIAGTLNVTGDTTLGNLSADAILTDTVDNLTTDQPLKVGSTWFIDSAAKWSYFISNGSAGDTAVLSGSWAASPTLMDIDIDNITVIGSKSTNLNRPDILGNDQTFIGVSFGASLNMKSSTDAKFIGCTMSTLSLGANSSDYPSGARFDSCEIGSTSSSIIAGAKSADIQFNNCKIWSDYGGTTNVIYNLLDADRVIFNGCTISSSTNVINGTFTGSSDIRFTNCILTGNLTMTGITRGVVGACRVTGTITGATTEFNNN